VCRARMIEAAEPETVVQRVERSESGSLAWAVRGATAK
jgi:hypothetical protein